MDVRKYFVAAAISVVLPSVASAQICRGTADISSLSTFQGGGQFGFSEEATSLAGVISGGADSYFAEGNIGFAFVDELDVRTFDSRTFVGAQIEAANRRIVVCPGGSFATTYSSDFLGANLFGFGAGGGLSVGVIVAEAEALQVIPSFGLLVERWRMRYSAGESVTQQLNLGQAEFGVGLVLNRRFSMKPSIGWGFLDGEGNAFMMMFTVSR